LVSGHQRLTDEALIAIGHSQQSGTLFVSPISAWELTIAAQKPLYKNPPDLEGAASGVWFRQAVKAVTAKIVTIDQRVAVAAATVVAETNHKDPGDCHLIATAKVKKIPLVTRDAAIRKLAASGYLDVIVC